MERKRQAIFLLVTMLAGVSVCGCVAVLAGTAGGAGTAVWLSGKLSQEVGAPLEKAIEAAHKAMQSLKLETTKETKAENVAQIIGKYSDGKTVWIDIRPVTTVTSKIDVRVGAMTGDKEAADKILKKIRQYL